jgi:hypothetical protein
MCGRRDIGKRRGLDGFGSPPIGNADHTIGASARATGARSSRQERLCPVYGKVMRPGALLAPLWVWQLLQSPVLAVPDITLSRPVELTTLAW